MRFFLFLEAIPNPSLIPVKPSGGCPSGTTDWNGVMCCCGNSCCWDVCRWDYPPENCLSGLENAVWMKDSSKQRYTAQYRKFENN